MAHYKEKSGKHRIICVETGEIYDNQTECAKRIGISPSYLSACIRFGDVVKGRHYIKEVV